MSNPWYELDSIIDDLILASDGDVNKLDAIINEPFNSRKKRRVLEEIKKKEPIYRFRRKLKQKEREHHEKCKVCVKEM